jgi:tripartite-type tricarboxylate transporter receptor subunit TctC
LLANSAWVLASNPSLPVRSVKELIALAKKRPGQINYASTGNGGSTHLAAELLKSLAGINLAHIPYKGTVPAVNDLLSGHVELTIAGLAPIVPHVKTGRLRLLGAVGSSRSAVMPELPTIGESVPGYEYNNWFGVVAPRATPPDVITQLHDSIVRALQTNEVKSPLLAQAIEPAGTTSAQFGDLIRVEITRYTKLAKEIGVSVD